MPRSPLDYTGLELEACQVRLITIKPCPERSDPNTSRIHCEINVATLPPEPLSRDKNALPPKCIDFNHCVPDPPEEVFGASLRRDVGLMEEELARDGIQVPITDFLKLVSLEDLLSIVANEELNDNFRMVIPMDDPDPYIGVLPLEDLSPFFRPRKEDAPPPVIDPNNYVAMSYAWGTEAPTKPIFLNGKEIHVRQNLEAGLRQFRNMDYFRRRGKVWIDAISINQSNKEEVDAQVQMMGSIYRLAGNVIVWLGPEADGSEKAIRSLEAMKSSAVSTVPNTSKFSTRVIPSQQMLGEK
jgi:hypothetical protein